jgi:hypothetical protein
MQSNLVGAASCSAPHQYRRTRGRESAVFQIFAADSLKVPKTMTELGAA